MDDFLIIFAAACVAWGLGAALVVAICDDRDRLAHLAAFIRTHWSH
ncbi:hypothetical protein [Streptomyces sp.]|nr:hypothetical protein [Streptomyces sp.]HET6356051.1 hypothetical protein [Streptomyces sp.]